MKSVINYSILFLVLFPVLLFSETNSYKKNAIILGVLTGGGSLVGLEYERMIYGPLGITIGGGIIGIGAQVNLHFKPSVTSSGVSLVWWNQGIPGNTASQQILGLCFTARLWKWVHASLGFGYAYWQGAKMAAALKNTKFMLLYNIGVSFCFGK